MEQDAFASPEMIEAARQHALALTATPHVMNSAALMMQGAEIWRQRSLMNEPHEVEQSKCADFSQTLLMTSGMLTILAARRDMLEEENASLRRALGLACNGLHNPV